MTPTGRCTPDSGSAAPSPARRARAVLARFGGGIATLAATVSLLLLLTFTLGALSPVDPVLQQIGDHASERTYQEVRHALGLDQALPWRFAGYVAHLLHGDLGVSQATGEPVLDGLARVFPATLELATLAILVSAPLGLALGMRAAARPGGGFDTLVRGLALLANSLPSFWIGLLLLYLFYARLQWVGGPGRLGDAYEYTLDHTTGVTLIDALRSGMPGAVASAVAHLVFPVLVLAANALGNLARMTRAAVVDELSREYVTLARAKGAGEARVIWRHVLPNVTGFLCTVVALAYANLLEGAVLTETVFAWPGLGRYLTSALFAADTPAILGATLLIGLVIAVLNQCTRALVGQFEGRP